MHVGDGVVPHTPVLNEMRQLATAQRAQTLPSTPADQAPVYTVPQLAESSLVSTQDMSSGIHKGDYYVNLIKHTYPYS